PVKRNINQFRECLDQSLALAVDQVNVKQLQPAFDALGDQLNRFSKAFEALTASPDRPAPAL
ncbi:jg25596, partial [Pararge aegeria aegeria]